MHLHELTRYLDEYLNNAGYSDASLNGLQVEGRGEVQTIALAVDASLQAINAAIEGNADLLLTHHGLFWGAAQPLTGWFGRRIRHLMTHNLSLYTSHLPLDAHPEVGNNIQLAKLFGWHDVAPFGTYKNKTIGYIATLKTGLHQTELLDLIETKLHLHDGELRVWGATDKLIKRVGIVSGGAATTIDEAITAHCDAFITGEPNYGATFPAIESNVPLICAGHYHTETLGVQALGKHLEDQFGLKTFFIDAPTGV